jgi:branched-chain amino acid transport system substrate-binding protein
MSRRRRPAALLCAVLAVSLVSSACGLKPAERDALKQASAGQGPAAGGVAGPAGGLGLGTTSGAAGGTAPGSTTTGGTALGTTGGAVGGTGTTSAGTTGAGGTGSTGGGTTAGKPGTTGGGASTKCSTAGGDATGVTASTINIGIHAPQSGTGAPLPPSFQAGVAAYWKTHKVCGRTVNVDFQDDKYTPPTARQVCEPMARRDFIVIGAAGTDQIQSCATDPAIAGKVPYLSAGVTTNGLTGLNSYFAFSLTYAQQSDLVLKNAKQQGYGMKKWAVITSRTDNFKDARDSMESVLKNAGVPFDDIQVDATNDSGLQGRAAQTGTKLATGGYDTVFVDTAPGYFVYMSQAASKQGFTGTYVGPGVTMTEVTVAQLICGPNPTIKANFLAPYPGIDKATDDFKAATGNKYDDIYWSLWGLSQALEQALNASSSLTRQGFMSSLQNATLPGGVYPTIKFAGGHFGGTAAYSQVVNCSKTEPNQSQPGAWDTVGSLLTK